MNSLYLIRIINRFSIAFGLLQFIFANFNLKINGIVLFVFMSMITYLAVLFKYKKILKLILETALLLPVLYYGLNYKSLFTIITFIFALYIIKNIDTSYESSADEFNLGIKILIIFFLISFISQTMDIFSTWSAGYIILYIISSIIILRTLRLIKYNQNNKYAVRSNILYSVIISSISVLFCFKNIRDYILVILIKLYDKIIDIFIYIFSWLFYAVGYILTILFNLFWKLIKRAKLHPQNGDINIAKLPEYPDRKSLIESIFDIKLVNVLIKVLVIFIISYILIKLLLKKTDKKEENIDYTESREFIKDTIKQDKNIIKKLHEYFNLRSSSEYIRFYYRKFLKMCLNNKINIKSSDTTKEINKKSELIFNKDSLRGIRDIYLDTRYGETEADSGTLKKFKQYLNKLKSR